MVQKSFVKKAILLGGSIGFCMVCPCKWEEFIVFFKWVVAMEEEMSETFHFALDKKTKYGRHNLTWEPEQVQPKWTYGTAC